MDAQSRERAVEFFLIVAIGIVLLMILKRVNTTNAHAVQYQRALEDISARVHELSRRLATPGGAPQTDTPDDPAAPEPGPPQPEAHGPPLEPLAPGVRIERV